MGLCAVSGFYAAPFLNVIRMVACLLADVSVWDQSCDTIAGVIGLLACPLG